MGNVTVIDVMPNLRKDIPIKEKHRIDIDTFCPHSNNPQKGSYIEIEYMPIYWFLEVYSLHDFIQSFKGGKKIGNEYIRDMEQTIQVIYRECKEALDGINIRVYAYLILDKGNMEITINE